ncbi:MAG TPA: pyrroline-5-carboxylate reductase dimerization domain-containing protein [Allosphingosinicella sp.]|nr:pyrroline-5-carboxylate reductase dimerization domain-containing protein [Allosphingosinicella sp.]
MTHLSAFTHPLHLLGCGNMAGAMLKGWLDAGLDPAQVTVIRPSGAPVADGVRVLTAPPEGEVAGILLLGMKPQKLAEAAPAAAAMTGPGTTIVSILAGVELATLRARFPAARTILRAMPNMPVALRLGVTNLIAEAGAGDEAVEALMAALGHAEWFNDESLFALAGHLTGAAPAFLYRFLDALAAAGVELGLDPARAARLAAAMARGAATLAATSDEAPAELARRVASPGGTTEAGLKVLDSDEALKRLMLDTLDASRRRGIEMSEAARRP